MRLRFAGRLVLAAPVRLPDRVHLSRFGEAADGKRFEGRSHLVSDDSTDHRSEFPKLGCLYGSSALRSSGLSSGIHATMASADSSRRSRARGLPE